MTSRKQARGRNPATPERMPGDTAKHDTEAPKPAPKAKAAADETDDELEDALEQTFPASDPIAMESTLVPGSRR